MIAKFDHNRADYGSGHPQPTRSLSHCVALIHEPSAPYRVIDTEGPAEDLFGLPRMMIVGRGIPGLVDNLDAHSKSSLETYLSGESATMNRRLHGTDLHYSSFPVFFRKRSVSVTVFYRAEPQQDPRPPSLLEESMPLFRHAFELTSKATCIIDAADSAVTHFNRPFADMWGLIPETFFGSPETYALSQFKDIVDTMAEDTTESTHFLRLETNQYSAERRLRLTDGHVIDGMLHRVDGYEDDTCRYVMMFSRRNVEAEGQMAESIKRYRMLTPRQKHVAAEVVTGKTNSEIAFGLGVCVKTVEKHRGAAMSKLRIGSVPDLVRLMQQVEHEELGHASV